MRDPRLSVAAVIITLACALLVTLRVVFAAAPAPPRVATPAEREQMAYVAASYEPGWDHETTQNFPSDAWSQRDDFHAREFKKVLELAREKGVRIEDVLRGIDDDIHQRGATRSDAPSDRHARAIPCKPRPFYD